MPTTTNADLYPTLLGKRNRVEGQLFIIDTYCTVNNYQS